MTTNAPLPSPSSRGIRYGLMNEAGMYFVHPHMYDGRWREWDHSPHDAHFWVDLDACHAAATVWHATHGETLVVVTL